MMNEEPKIKFKTTETELEAVKTVFHDAASFPDGIKAAWQFLEEKLGSLKGRKMYALLWFPQDGPIYRVCSTFEEGERLDLPEFTIPGGKYGRIKIENWPENIDHLHRAAKQLNDKYGWKPGRPQIEFYRSKTEAHMLHPIDE